MGASSWSYFVPYREDIGAALEALRKRVFQTREYLDPDASLLQVFSGRAAGKKLLDRLPDELREEIRKEISLRRARRPATIEDLLERAGAGGTHSILDIVKIGARPGRAAAAPLGPAQRRKLYGTLKPDRVQVETRLYELMNLRPAWKACYVVVYRDGRPSEICFAGSSGE